MRFATFLLLILVCHASASNVVERDFGEFFGPFEGTIVVCDIAADTFLVHNVPRSTVRFTPFSTFKIANSMVALETGVVKSIDAGFEWDSTRYPAEEWWPKQWYGTHTMRTAIKYSVVPFYREIATLVGHKRMVKYVRKFGYGNQNISSGEDDFWLNGSLAISAMEQIEFLRRFYSGSLPVESKTIAATKKILVQEETGTYRLSAKTGAGSGFDKDNPNKALGWYVGYVEKDEKVHLFAMNIEGDSFGEILTPRKEITKAVLGSMEIVE